jgi:hypothetical protein
MPEAPTTIPMRVCLDGTPAWRADVVCHTGTVNPIRWNGFIADPRFDRVEAEDIVQYINESNAQNRTPDGGIPVEGTFFTWAGDLLIRFEWDGNTFGDAEPKYERSLIEPDANGRYAIGAYSWVWYEARFGAARIG